MNVRRAFHAAVLVVMVAVPVTAQTATPDFTITAQERKETIESALARLKEAYVYPEKAAEMEKAVRQRMAAGEYDAITSGKALAAKLTDDLRAVSHDKHLSVKANAEGVPDFGSDAASAEKKAKMLENGLRVNFGFEKVERLQGNVGYIDIRGFMAPELAAATGAAAMNFVAHTDALIVDLRKNSGGDGATVAFLISYLFDEQTRLDDIYTRKDNSTQQWWTLPYVPGPTFGGKKPVYVLTSAKTFSAGEAFAYDLKSLKRATIIGETTGGGAHPVELFKASRRFAIGVPFARAINPITKTNWEGTGVTPDVALPADQAFDRAYAMALESIVATTENPQLKMQLQNLLREKTKS